MKRPGPSHLRRDLSWVDLCPQHQVRSPTLDKGPHSLERKDGHTERRHTRDEDAEHWKLGEWPRTDSPSACRRSCPCQHRGLQNYGNKLLF